MEYTKEELIAIDNATMESHYYLELAYWDLERFICCYLDDDEPKELIFALQNYPEAIRSIFETVHILLKLSLTELDKFSDCENWTVEQVIRQHDEIMKIKKIYQTEKEKK